MSVGPLPNLIGLAALPMAQTSGSEIDRLRQDSARNEARIREQAKADDAAGVAEADSEEKRAEDRDADGRRAWEQNSAPHDRGSHPEDEPTNSTTPDESIGGQLDLSG